MSNRKATKGLGRVTEILKAAKRADTAVTWGFHSILKPRSVAHAQKETHSPQHSQEPAGIITEAMLASKQQELHLIFLLAGAVQTAAFTVKCKGR